ncbi:MAG: putative collagen-binding domain-containing protein, partial [Planctomycetota bacterium]
PWEGHPYHRDNNVNAVDGDRNGDHEGRETHTLAVPAVTRLQEAYVRQVIDTVGDLDNVLYEISNESHGGSAEWQYHFIRFIHDYEQTKPKRHPVGMTFPWGRERRGTNASLFQSPAEWISPNAEGGYRDDPPPADGRKVILTDTDHLWGIGGNAAWVWKSFMRGLNPIFMDPYLDARTGHRLDPKWDPIRRAMGQTLVWARRVDIARMVPRPELATSRYCLAPAGKPAAEYLVYLPSGGKMTVDLTATPGRLAVEWFRPASGESIRKEAVGGARRELTAPFGGETVVYLHQRQ